MMNQPCEIKCQHCPEIFNSMGDWGNHFIEVHSNKCDDIPVSTSGENVSHMNIGSTSQHNNETSDVIKISTNNESVQDIDFDPPSPVYRVRNIKRIRANSLSDSDSVPQMTIEKKDESPKENFY